MILDAESRQEIQANKDASKGKETLLKNKNTEDGVNFRGKGCNIPPICP